MVSKKLEKLLTLLGFGVSIISLYFVARNIADVEAIIAKAGMTGPVVALVLYGLLAPTPIPTDSITIVCGALYGPIYGSAIAWMGNNIAALVEYYIGWYINKSMDFEKEKEKLPLGLGKLPINSIPVLTVGRMLPFYGAKIISILAGIYKVPLKRYVWTSILINLTGAIMLAYGGYKILDALKTIF